MGLEVRVLAGLYLQRNKKKIENVEVRVLAGLYLQRNVYQLGDVEFQGGGGGSVPVFRVHAPVARWGEEESVRGGRE